MPSYLITGASRGIGFEFVRQLSSNPENKVIALVRNKEASSKLSDLTAKNVYVVQADIVDHAALKVAAAEVSKYTGGKLDVLINNAALFEPHYAYFPLTAFEGQEDLLAKLLHDSFDVNVVGVVHTINAFLPLLRAGTTKKIITLSTGIADPEFLHQAGNYVAAPYCISKAATNMVVTKYAIKLKDEGFVFLALSPGLVNTMEREPTPGQVKFYMELVDQCRKIKPTLEGPITPEVSVKAQLQVIDRATVKDTGAFISHNGNRDWL